MSRILVISFSDLATDPRVDRQITFLRSEHEVVAAGWGAPAEPDIEFIDLLDDWPRLRSDLIRRTRSAVDLIARRGEPAYWRLPFVQTALHRLRTHRADLVIANDLQALPLGCWVADGAPVIFDAHELSTEEHGDRLWWRAIHAPQADVLLGRYLPQTSGMMTVSRAIAQRYEVRYGVPVQVVTNAPPASPLTPSPVSEPIRLIHHGGAVPERQIELMVKAIELLDDRFELTLMLTPSWPRYYAQLERLVAAVPRVRLVEPVPQREIVATCNSHDIGVYLLPPSNENLRLALPNKLFEFIQARLAIAVGPSPEMARIVRDHGCGVVADDFTPGGLANALAGLTPDAVLAYKQAADTASPVLSAETNREIVLELVARALCQTTDSTRIS